MFKGLLMEIARPSTSALMSCMEAVPNMLPAHLIQGLPHASATRAGLAMVSLAALTALARRVPLSAPLMLNAPRQVLRTSVSATQVGREMAKLVCSSTAVQ